MSLHFLLVEDNPQNRLLAKTVLTYDGHTVVEAENATRACTALQGEKFDAVLMDLQLPDLDGFELARRIKADFRFARIPLIAVSSFATREIKSKAQNAGFAGFVEKPIDVENFSKQICAILN